ncbi:flagellar basal body L-ring protein FlgH [Thiohalorhabdus sp.]|uniref:flagellar basal body L-ring protein FlgH n=1 Tax=Thiohalorhabdus sp. TaxID=3094134 RepID=UPI002FC31C33
MTIRTLAIAGALVALAGCAAGPSPEELESIDKEVAQAQANAPAAKPSQGGEGSLWGQSQQEVFADNKAHQVGDIITVELAENTQGNNSASTQAERQTSNEAGVSAFLGLEESLADKNPRFEPETSIGTSTSNEMDGSGETSRSASLSGNMTAVVVDVFANGNMRIKGRRAVTINHEVQNMVLSGVIRPQDIGPSNSITSSQIANARIQYAGNGVVARQQDEGWMTKVLHTVWPF